MRIKLRERVVLYGLREIHQAGSIFILILAPVSVRWLSELMAPRILFVKFSWADGALQLDIAIRVSHLARPV